MGATFAYWWLPKNWLDLAYSGLYSGNYSQFGLPDFGRLWDFLRRVQELLTMGGVLLAIAASLVFIFAWVASHARQPNRTANPILPHLAFIASIGSVALTLIAAFGTIVPPLAPFILKAFAFAVLVAGLSWTIAVTALIMGGSSADLSRARKALLLAGTPWYCLALWLSRYL